MSRLLDELLRTLPAVRGRGPRIGANANWLHDQEATLRSEVDHAVINVVYTRNPGDMSFIGTPREKYASEYKAIASFVWQNFPYPSEQEAVSALGEHISLVFKPRIETALCAEMASAVLSLLRPPFRGAGPQAIRSIRYYLRHCSWCAAEIAEKKPALVLYGVTRKRRPRFCSEDWFQNWDSVYWQKSALQHSALPEKESDSEKRRLKRQLPAAVLDKDWKGELGILVFGGSSLRNSARTLGTCFRPILPIRAK